MDAAPKPIQKQVLLLGAGNAHLRFVRAFRMRPVPGVAVTLVSEAAVIPYSAMVPGHIARDYAREEVTIDLVRLCRASGVRFVAACATGLDPHLHTVTFAGRPDLGYDVLSLGLGSRPAQPPGLAQHPASWPMRPLDGLLDSLAALEQSLQATPRPFHLVVVGGGASGCELSLAIHKRFRTFSGFRLTVLHGGDRLLPGFATKTSHLFTELFRARHISLRLDRVIGGDTRSLELASGERIVADAVVWATHAAPPAFLAETGLRLDDNGFLLVEDTLQAVGQPGIFATGDCAALVNHPGLAKNGVLAVRQGGILFDNVLRHLRDQPLKPFRPQSVWLCLLNTSDGEAIFNWGPLVWKGWLARWIKDRIDRAWIDKFTRFPAMGSASKTGDGNADDNPLMRCGGCGSKVSSDVLGAVLSRLDPGEDPRIVLGCRAGEDASVHRCRPALFGPDPDRLVEIQTVDYFKTFLDDPYLFGRIAALAAVSDCYAMNARPFSALAIATLPLARGPIQERMLFEMLSGAIESLRGLGVTLTGGHTTEGTELALGFAVTGFGEEDELFRKGYLRPGEALILTRPLGSGALLAAWMRGACRADWYRRLLDEMLQANERAARLLAGHGVRACTDVTGFGLAGHLLEMLDASRVSARLYLDRIPVYDGFAEVAAQGILSTLQPDNAKMSCRVEGEPPAWLFDPQTAGGLLASVPGEHAETIVRELRSAGYPATARIGEVVPADPAPIIRLERSDK